MLKQQFKFRNYSQPIKRFDLNSAIIFSDILLVPHALGQKVTFLENQGPQLSEFNLKTFYKNDEHEFSLKLDPVYKAIKITRTKLSKNKSLICFVGAPWTLLVYMLNIKKNKTQIDLQKLNKYKSEINNIINYLVNFLCIHIKNQIKAGADVVQIFDSWAGLIPEQQIEDYCYIPSKKIVSFCKQENIPNIFFPKGLGEKYERFNRIVLPDGLNLDYDIDPQWARDNLNNVIIQGGLNPSVLLPDEQIYKEATKYMKIFKDSPYVFNLGHGLLPETDPDKVEKLIKFYRNF